MIGDALIDFQSARANNVTFLGRVRSGDKNPFPKQVNTVFDLNTLLAWNSNINANTVNLYATLMGSIHAF